MSYLNLAFVFPAFAGDYTDHPGRNIPGFEDVFNELLDRAIVSVDRGLAGFNFAVKASPENELNTQYLTYIYSCAASSLLRKAGFQQSMNVGYSMGIYAAIFDARAISFETGLALIKTAYQELLASLDSASFGMGTLIGLSGFDIQQLIDQSLLHIEITNQNAPHSFVVSGVRDDILKLMELAKKEGALHTRNLPVSIPYHSSYLKNGAMEFARQINHLKITAPVIPVISLIDQISLSTPDIIRQELFRNLFQPLNWFRTMNVMLEKNISQFIECGPSKGLAKNSKFVEGVTFSPMTSILH